MLIGLVGKKRSGKDTFALRLTNGHSFKRLAFADRLKDAALAINPLVGWEEWEDEYGPAIFHGVEPVYLAPLVERVGWEAAKEVPNVRQFLQNLGVSVREHLGLNAWIRPVMQEVDSIRFHLGGSVVITDVRFPNEADAIEERGGWLVRIVREGTGGDGHVSETALDDRATTFTVENNGSIDDLLTSADRVVGALRFM